MCSHAVPSLPDLNSKLRPSSFGFDGELDQFSVDIEGEKSSLGSDSEGREDTTAIRDLL